MAVTSRDGGKTWSLPRTLLALPAHDAANATMPPSPYVTANRLEVLRTYGKGKAGAESEAWLLPVWTESHGFCGEALRDGAMVLASDDYGVSWGVCGPGPLLQQPSEPSGPSDRMWVWVCGGVATQLRGRVQRGNATWLIENTLAVADARGTLLQLFRTRVRLSLCSAWFQLVSRTSYDCSRCQPMPFDSHP